MKSESAARREASAAPGPRAPVSQSCAQGVQRPESRTRQEVATLLMRDGPVSASEAGSLLGISAAGVRRHIDALVGLGEAEVASGAGAPRRGPGRPAKLFQLTPAGKARFRHAYDDLAEAALLQLHRIGGDEAIAAFAQQRAEQIIAPLADVSPHDGPLPDTTGPGRDAGDAERATGSEENTRLMRTAEGIAEAMSAAGYIASTRAVGNGVQICRHHCPVADVAAEFPEFCEAEQRVFQQLLGTHIQQLATIANGDSVCTTHVPLRQATPRSDTLSTPSGNTSERARPAPAPRERPG